MKKVQIDPATQQRNPSRKQLRNAKIKQKLTQQVEVQIIPALEDMEGYEKRKPRVCAYCRVSTDMDTQALSYELLGVRWHIRGQRYIGNIAEAPRGLQANDRRLRGR